MNVIRIISEEINKFLLNEALENIDEDVDLIYNKFFKDDVEEFNQTKKITNHMFLERTSDTSMLKTQASLKAHQQNPCNIYINDGKNAYNPIKNKLYMSLHQGVVNMIRNAGSLEIALYNIDAHQKNSFKDQITDKKIKGSIHHELLHWLDDTFNNLHIKKELSTASEIGINRALKGKNVNTSKIEIQGQMGNVKQFKNITPQRVYDNLSFQDLINSIPTLQHINGILNSVEKIQWKKDLLSRMNRENLLGNNMKQK